MNTFTTNPTPTAPVLEDSSNKHPDAVLYYKANNMIQIEPEQVNRSDNNSGTQYPYNPDFITLNQAYLLEHSRSQINANTSISQTHPIQISIRDLEEFQRRRVLELSQHGKYNKSVHL